MPEVDRGPGRGVPYRHHLAWPGHAWRLAVVLVFSLTAWVSVLGDRTPAERVVDVALGVLAFVLVSYRRRRPLAVAVACVVLAAFSLLATGPSILAIVSLATGRHWKQVVGVGVLSVLSGEVLLLLNPTSQTDPRWVASALNTAFAAATIAWGMYVGSRRELLWNLRRRAEVAEAERDLRVAQSRLEERTRIAREMHDVLAHRISQIAVRAGALHYRTDLGPDEVRDSAEIIRDSAHLALTDLRGVLGLLRDGTGEPQRVPQPAYDDLVDLVEEARSSGMRVTVDDELRHHVPDGVGRTVYRIVQEGLTNARKHAPAAEVGIELTGTPGEGVAVVMRNAVGFERTATPGAGLGLVGLMERAELSGGTLEHGREGPDFVVRAWVPWDR